MLTPAHTEELDVFAESRAYAVAGHYAEARAMVRWLLGHNPENREALMALARLDTWEGCFDRAEPVYRSLLRQRPHDIEARAGLINLLFWSNRYPQARVLIDRGLKLDPEAPELWQRRARYLLWTGDRDRALDAANHAAALAPTDAEILAVRDPLFLGQARTGLRMESFPENYPNIYTADIQALQHFHRFELGATAQFIDRVGGAAEKAIVDGRYGVSAQYHTSGGTTVGVGLGFGAPDKTIPAFEGKTWFSASLTSHWTAELSYNYWRYWNDKAAHIFAPSVGFAATDDIQLTARWSMSYLTLADPTKASMTTGLVHSGGLRTTWHCLPPLTLGVGYAYGRQLDQTARSYTFLKLTSHVASVFADWRVQRRWGIQPGLGFEARKTESGVAANVFSGEVATYLRW